MYTVQLIYSSVKVEIPCSSIGTAHVAWRKFLAETYAGETAGQLVRIKVLGPNAEVVFKINAISKGDAA
jgi:hypothetical protein